MRFRNPILAVAVLITCPVAARAEAAKGAWWRAEVEQALSRAKDNRPELEKALADVPRPAQGHGVPHRQHAGRATCGRSRPTSSLANCELAYKARERSALGQGRPRGALPQRRAALRQRGREARRLAQGVLRPVHADGKACKTPTEAAAEAQRELFKKLKLEVLARSGRPPNQSPEGVDRAGQGVLHRPVDRAERRLPGRRASRPAWSGTPLWANKRGNHTWVEIWDKDWHFTGACEPDPNGLDRGWFVGDAAEAKKDSLRARHLRRQLPEDEGALPAGLGHGQTGRSRRERHRPLREEGRPGSHTVRVMVRVANAEKKRVAVPVTVTEVADPKTSLRGKSRGETADANDFLTFDLKPNRDYAVRVAGAEKTIKTGPAGGQQTVEITAR